MKSTTLSMLCLCLMATLASAQPNQRTTRRDRQQPAEQLKSIVILEQELVKLKASLQEQAKSSRREWTGLTKEEQSKLRQELYEQREDQRQTIQVIERQVAVLKGSRELRTEYLEGLRRLEAIHGLATQENAELTAQCLAAMVGQYKTAFEEKLTALEISNQPHVSTKDAVPRSNFLPGQLWPDNHGIHINAHGGGILFHDGAYYWFGEHKTEGGNGNRANVGVHCYRSTDLYNWADAGIALPVSNDPNSDIVKGSVIERPKVIYCAATKKFVMWFHLELKGQGYDAARTGVAVSDEVTGPYRFIESSRHDAKIWPENMTADQQAGPASDEGLESWSDVWKEQVVDGLFVRRDFERGQMARDMTLFVDDDGKAYHIHASEENLTLHIAQLSDDYLSFSGRYHRVFPGGHNEAPAVFKRDGKYYLLASGCTGWEPNAARSAVADSIWGPWKMMDNPCVGVNPNNVLGPEKTFGGQSTFVLPVQGKRDAFIAMFDMWRPRNAIDGRYLWLPIEFTDEHFQIKWVDQWDLSVFEAERQTRTRDARDEES
jgi:hypothetical protein